MNETKIISTKKIIETVAGFYNVSVKDIRSRCRKKELVKARHIIMYFLREDLRNSYPEIGRRIGNRDHTTAIYAYAKIKSDLQKKEALQREIESLRAMFRGQELRILRKPEKIVKEKTITVELQWKGMLQRLRAASPSFIMLEREKSMLEEWRLGKTLAHIAKEWKLTRERIRQIITIGILREIAEKIDQGFEIDIEEVLKQEKKRHGTLRDQRVKKIKAETGNKKATKLEKPKRWSRYYIQCKQCGTTILPHFKYGLCERCSGVFRGKRREKIISRVDGKCEMCGKDRFSVFREMGRDFYITRLNPKESSSLKYMILCRKCFLKLTGKKMAVASRRKKNSRNIPEN